MVSVEQADAIIREQLVIPATEVTDIMNAVGSVLGEAVTADRDLPPFDRVSMDGIAIRFADFKEGHRDFAITGVQAAGKPASKLSGDRSCIEVMTGAMLPSGADTVVRYEDTKIAGGSATVITEGVTRRQNIHSQTQDARMGDVLLTPGVRISPAEIALLASVGKSKVQVRVPPHTAIISTGDELVDIKDDPMPWQIRRSNSYALWAALQLMKVPSTIYHVPDDPRVLEEKIRTILTDHQIIILSGGVSKGKFDHVPRTLESAGVVKKFHQVSQKPGKPFWFGRSKKNTVFALPGNPVSTFMCFYRYMRPWLELSLGCTPRPMTASLASDFTFRQNLTYFLQVKTSTEEGHLRAHPDPGGGSGDFANLKDVDGFLELPLGKTNFNAGDSYPYYPFRQA